MLTFRSLADADLPLLAAWLGRPHVQQWWKDPSAPTKVAEKYLPRIRGTAPTEGFVIVSDGRALGMIQRYRIGDYPETERAIAGTGHTPRSAAGIDYMIGEPELLGRGIGSAAIAAFTDKVLEDYRDVDSILVTPQAENIASCRVLEKAGYEQLWVGLLDSDHPADAGLAVLYERRR